MAQNNINGMRELALINANERGGINTPPMEDFNTEAMQGSFQQILSENLGQYVVVEFLIGTQSMVEKAGILYAVGRSFLTLFEETSQTFVVCDIFSVKFVTFYLPGQRPQRFAGPGSMGTTLSPSAFGPVTQGAGGGVTFSSLPNTGNMMGGNLGNNMGGSMGNQMGRGMDSNGYTMGRGMNGSMGGGNMGGPMGGRSNFPGMG